MALTYELYPGDGVQTDFNIPATYLDEDYVTVHVDGDPVEFELLNSGTVRLAEAPALGTTVRVGRDTRRDILIVTIPESGNFDTDDINKQSMQVLHIVAEAFDRFDGTLALGLNGQWDGLGYRYTHLAEPVDLDDAVTKRWAMEEMTSELGQAIAARNAAQAAQASSESARDATHSYMNLTDGYKSTTLGYMNTTLEARDVTTEARDVTTGARDVTLDARDITTAARTETLGYKDLTYTYMQTTLSYRNDAEASKVSAETSESNAAASAAAAANSAQALGSVRINGSGEVEFEVNGVVVAKIDASGNFLLKGNVGIFQTF